MVLPGLPREAEQGSRRDRQGGIASVNVIFRAFFGIWLDFLRAYDTRALIDAFDAWDEHGLASFFIAGRSRSSGGVVCSISDSPLFCFAIRLGMYEHVIGEDQLTSCFGLLRS